MSLLIPTLKIPQNMDQDQVIRVGETRVTLDTVVAAFLEGATSEEIVQQYPSLELADVYLVIGFFLRIPAEVERHLGQRRRLSEVVKRKNETKFDPQGVRDRLLARRDRKE